jgi:hypothetical protein
MVTMQNVTGDRLLDELLAAAMPPGRPQPGQPGEGDGEGEAEGEDVEDDKPA